MRVARAGPVVGLMLMRGDLVLAQAPVVRQPPPDPCWGAAAPKDPEDVQSAACGGDTDSDGWAGEWCA